ncbi:MAG TPA: hypothetical protein VFX97_15900 [Pyrinomonadaceae bacterium]|nr:hypothetical protein [Pyrinomonadaceae bacterium]
MLEIPFQGIDLYIFDVHTTIRPLTFNNCLQERFRFLVEPAAYRKTYLDAKSTLTKSFDVHPLSQHAQTKNHFWKNYLNLFSEGAPDVWQMQAPFVCSLRQPIVTLADDLGFTGSIRPRIYVSALGWSTSLSIHLRGEIHLSALLDFILGLIGTRGKSGLRFDGQAANISFVFRGLAERLLEEVYDKAHPPKTGAPQVPRRMVISLSKFEGTPLHYKKTLDRKGMSSEEQALLHSLLRGEEIGVKDLAQKLRSPSATVVRFEPDADFMLIYFEYGALVFMQRTARLKDKRQRSLTCFSSNTCAYAIMIWTLFHFYHGTVNTSNEAVKAMRQQVRANLAAMKDKYLSSADTTRDSVQFGKAFFKNNTDLKKIFEESA